MLPFRVKLLDSGKKKLYQAPVLLPGPTKVIQCKQYRIPGGYEEISKTVKNYLKNSDET